MLKNILWAMLIFTSALVSGSVFQPLTATAGDNDADNPKKYTLLFFIQGLNNADIDGPGLPNMKKLKSEGISYQHLSKTVSSQEQVTSASVLGPANNRFLLPQTLSDNSIDCLAVDGTGTITASPARENRLELIIEKNDRLAVDKFLNKTNKSLYQFTAIYLDDISAPGKLNNSAAFQQWSLADNQIGRILNHLIQLDKLAYSTIIITGGGEEPPLIVFNISTNQPKSFHHCRQMDIAPTICSIYGITPPTQMPGNILYESLPLTSSQSINNLNRRIIDLQKECRHYNQQISILQKEQRSVKIQKEDIKKERENIHRIISEKDNTVQKLSRQIKILKFLGTFILIILIIGYIFQYRWLRKKFLMFP
ncbi:hypothetical protein [Desulfoscipio sp. XC116]|uniref:hypothetical protein n=1 Tax=Desulfoscipio sp. XC116 TaxID=3144975 RepID=UPI00325AAC5B